MPQCSHRVQINFRQGVRNVEYLAWIWPNRPNVFIGWVGAVDLLVVVIMAGTVLIRRYARGPTQNER